MLSNELKQNPFSVPENYFESLQERVERKATVLGNELKNLPFAIPEGYFESLQERVSERISVTLPQHTPTFVERRSWRSQVAFAASFLLLVGIGYGMFSLLSPNPTDGVAPAEVDMYSLVRSISPAINEAVVLEAMLTGDVTVVKNEPLGNEDIANYLADADLSIYDIAAALE